jgi:hypothetical protein
MIEVRCDQTGDTGYAEEEHAALVAARELCQDAWNGTPNQGFSPTVTFLVEDAVVRSRVPEPAVWAALGAAEGHS